MLRIPNIRNMMSYGKHTQIQCFRISKIAYQKHFYEIDQKFDRKAYLVFSGDRTFTWG